MRSHATKLVAVLGLLAVFLLSATAAPAAVVDGIFPLKSEVGQNNKLATGPDGNIWVALESAEKDFAKISPTGQVEEIEVEDVAFPKGVAVGPEGRIWVTQNERVVTFSPASPNSTREKADIPAIKNESSIVAGPDGNMWVASDNVVLRFAPADLNSPTPFEVAGLAPRDIDVAGGLIAVADTGVAPRIVMLTTAGAKVEHPLAAKPQGLAGTPSGVIGFSQPDTQQVGLLSGGGSSQLFPQGEDPFGVALGADGAFWIVRAVGGGLTRLTTDGQVSQIGGLPATGFSARQITAGPGSTLWVTLVNPGEPGAVARISGVEPAIVSPPLPPPIASPQTKIDKGPKKVIKTRKRKARVKFRFSSPTAGVTFQCWLMRVSKKAQPAVLKYKACKSPKTYRLRPGKYKFRVRAVNGGAPDLTPAVRNFRIVRIR